MTTQHTVMISDNIKPYLDEISERLWTGHAAIMVGSGFSKNADPAIGVNNTFPTWNELANIFYRKIYGKEPTKQETYLNPLKLAEELEVLFGRAILEKLIEDNIPDETHNPTELFNKLLQLNWSDVFTTNYDTLLERAKDDITDRNYQVVVRKEDLINSQSPRIIKLHGSLRPRAAFIITEEDYRTYPKKFAPFVNTVQQALIEKTLCLVGFSGDDPNFLQWVGWIRDKFKKNTTLKIYLVGLVNLSEAQKRLLEKRNVNIVDLGSCPGVDGNNGVAIERFFDYLLSKKGEENKLDWPYKPFISSPGTDGGISELEKTIKKWKKTREEFPRWRIVPSDRRTLLRPNQDSYSWVNFISETENLPDLIEFQYIYEICWRLDKSLLPIWDEIATLAEKCLQNYCPFPEVVNLNINSSITLNKKLLKNELNSVKEQWIQISIYMLRYYREEGIRDKWGELENSLNVVEKDLSKEQIASLSYERALESFFRLDISSLENWLKSWPTNQSLPFWEAKRAGLLAEIGKLNEAQKILESSLKYIRDKQNLKPVSTDYSDVSDEAYLMLLLQCVKQSKSITESEYSKFGTAQFEYSERFNFLTQYKCDPRKELTLFEIELDSPYIETKEVSRKPTFRIGHATISRSYGSSTSDLITAYSFLRFCEDIGLAFHLPCLKIASKSAKGCLDRIGVNSPNWALITLLRTSDIEVAKEIFDRKYLFKLSVNHCNQLIDHLLNTLNQVKSRIVSDTSFFAKNFEDKLAGIIPVILSRLCCKASYELKDRLIDFIVDVYSSNHKSNYKGINSLVVQLLDSMSDEHQIQSISKLLKIPIPENLDHITEINFPNPFKSLRINKHSWTNQNSAPIRKERISYLIGKAKSKNQKVRDWAVFSLVILHELNLLTKHQMNDLGKVVWIQRDNHGFPLHTSFHKFSWLNLPNPSEIDVTHLLENYVSNLEIPIQSGSQNQGITMGLHLEIQKIAHELIGANNCIELKSDVFNLWLDKIVSWWESDKTYLTVTHNDIKNEFQHRFSNLTAILSQFILPNLGPRVTEESKNVIMKLISNLESYGIPSAQVKTAAIQLYKESKADAIFEIEMLFAERDRNAIQDAQSAILIAVENSNGNFKLEDQCFLISLALSAIIWNSSESIIYALNVMSEVVEKYPELINDDIEKKFLFALKVTAKNTDPTLESYAMSFEESLSVRKLGALVAYKYYLICSSRGPEISREILMWKTICESEQEFAEIKIQWIGI